MKRVLAALAAGALAFGALTGWALESGGVGVIETRDPEGGLRSTHVWYVESEGDIWLEAGTPENPWYRDVGGDPLVVFRAGRFEAPDAKSRFHAEPLEESRGHPWIREQMRAKYGLRDRWVSLLFDTSRSIAVRLRPAPQG